jgi:integrase
VQIENFRTAGLNEEALQCAVAAVAPATEKVYAARWKKFVAWCVQNEVCPTEPRPADIANFLARIHSQGARYSTVRGCLSAIVNTLKSAGSESLGIHPLITAVLPAMRREDIKRQKPKALDWDINVVLSSWSVPQSVKSVAEIVNKACFLVCFASAARVSELHALIAPPLFSDSGVSIQFNTNFIPKRTRCVTAHNSLPPLHITRLPEEESSVCPVVALQNYLQAIEHKGVQGSPLWIHPKSRVPATARHLAAWLRSTIAGAYRRADKQVPSQSNPHSIRAAAATWAWRSNVPMRLILEQCRWRHQTTFTKFYLKSVQESDGRECRLKPLAIQACS